MTIDKALGLLYTIATSYVITSMNYKTDLKKEQGHVHITCTVTPEEYDKHLKTAATRISNQVKIKGFRPGKAPYDMVVRELGEMRIMQEALESIIQEAYVDAVKQEELNIVGQPRISVEKLAPGNDVEFVAVVALLPEVTLPKLSKLSVKKDSVEVTDEQVQETIDALRGMKAEEIKKDGPAAKEDKITVDMNMLVDGVPVDGGQSKNYQVYLSEKHYIPGFNEELIGLSAGEDKTFELDFPKDHYQKMLAGKKVTIEVHVHSVEERKLPEWNDEFAKTVGKDTTEELKALIRSNMEHEQEHKAEEKLDIAILDAVIEATTFGTIPQVLIDAEKQRMFIELRRDLERRGISISDYLADLKKDEETLFEEFTEQATKRAKAALVSRQVAAEQESVRPSEADLKKELDLLRQTYANNKEYLERIDRQEIQDAIMVQLQNKNVTTWLKQEIMGKDYTPHTH
jgi:trigger factor